MLSWPPGRYRCFYCEVTFERDPSGRLVETADSRRQRHNRLVGSRWLYWTDDAGEGRLVRWNENGGSQQLTSDGWVGSPLGFECACGRGAFDYYHQTTQEHAAELAAAVGATL
jgi:hypothetical protein